MTTSTRARWLGVALATGLGLSSFALTSEAEAAPTPGNKIQGRGGNFGLGLSHGDPFGLSAKWFMHPNHALQSDIGWAPLHHGHGRFGIDYLWHPGTFFSNDTLDLVPYLGVGLGLGFWHNYCGGYRYAHCRGRYYDNLGYSRGYYYGGGAAFMIRAPILGIGIHWKKIPLDTMMEGSWSPYVARPDLAQGDFSLKVRYYF